MRYLFVISLFFVTGCLDYTLEAVDRTQQEIGTPEELVQVAGDNVVKAQAFVRWGYAANAGDAEAQYNLGKSLCCGKRPFYNTYDALRWFCAAAKQGQRDAMLEIGKIYQNAFEEEGSMVPRDNALAYTYYVKAVEHGNDSAKSFEKKLLHHLTEAEKVESHTLIKQWPKIQCEIH